MKKAVVVLACLVAGTGVWGSSALGAEGSDQKLSERIAALEEKLDGRISFSGAVEVEAGYTSHNPAAPGEKDEEESDLSLSTVEVGVDAELNQYVSGHVLFLYEEGENDDDVTVDEGYVLLEGKDRLPVYLKAGKEYVPFGRFESNMISDPLTLELGETRETALEVGFKAAGFYGAAYAFNGDVDTDEDNNDHVSNFGLSAGYAVEQEDFSFDLGAGWINNIHESGGLEDMLDDMNEDAADDGYSVFLGERVSGASLHVTLTAGPVSFFGEYVAMLDDTKENRSDLTAGSLAALGLAETETLDGMEAFNLELGYTFDLIGRETVLAAALQGAKNAGDWLPEERYLVSAGMEIFKDTTLALEYYHDEFETDDSGDGVTAQLAVGF